ncbi:amino acid ABC transporter permease [Nonomuraea sp. KC401]|uniref:amino acid ABC transporter permease n=1 Tax=unclassified Nonomuraea TaxID=2593643 RepID=UPI0010FD9016|nr:MULTISPECIES: amino acid ABC transporter permease [unclassified Nonomuraea]NBE91883.1 ABC transporter permease subunit [Nonomuraea sp. K271]TLF75524.1 amino acid ABC transporter permease [Nonomuraea sp. KC401]
MFNDLSWSVVLDDPGRSFLLHGAWVSLQLAVLAIIGSTVVGTLVALGRVSTAPALAPLRWLLSAYVEFFRNVPLLVQLVFWSFGMFSLDLVRAVAAPLNPVYSNQFLAGLLGLTIYTSAYVAEALRSGIQSVPRGQLEAARAGGLGYWAAMRAVVLPQAFALAFPAIGNQYISATKNTSVVMAIGVTDVVFQAQQIESATFAAFEAYTAALVIFVVICLAESALLSLVVRGMLARVRPGARTAAPTPALES